MAFVHFSNLGKALHYASQTFIGCLISWFALRGIGIEHPIWSMMTVFIVSDPDIHTTLSLARVRAINTAVGCTIGMVMIWLVGYSPVISLFAAAITVGVVVMIDNYPSNWRLAPATVVIIMDAGSAAQTSDQELWLALSRFLEITLGCVVALSVAWIYSRAIMTIRKRLRHGKPGQT